MGKRKRPKSTKNEGSGPMDMAKFKESVRKQKATERQKAREARYQHREALADKWKSNAKERQKTLRAGMYASNAANAVTGVAENARSNDTTVIYQMSNGGVPGSDQDQQQQQQQQESLPGGISTRP